MSSLYIHIPFCEKKCVYCAFYSIESFANRDRFLAALHREIAAGPEEGERIDTVFFGGGTPSILSPGEIGGIVEQLSNRYDIVPDAEVTMECNPGALNRDWLQGYRDAGINRLSFGVQSFHNDELQFLTRIHTAEEAEQNIRLVRQVFDNVSLDMIFALPNQTMERWQQNMERAVDLGTDHISAYALIFEEGTPLNTLKLKGTVAPASNDLEADMYEATVEFLAQNGLQQYETSNYARPGFECRHNIGYWERQTYVGFGPSAHSFAVGSSSAPHGRRWANVSSLTAYLKEVESDRSPIVSREELTGEQAVEEMLMLGLRFRGLDRQRFAVTAGSDITELAPRTLRMMTDHGFATITPGSLNLTPKGTIFADRFALELIDEILTNHPVSAAS